MFGKTKSFHFVGIGGIGMSGIAEILVNLGYSITGSDLRDSEIVQRLREQGAKISLGHSATNILDQDVVITSSAIPATNPEVIEAHKRRIPIIHRSEMLAELVRLKMGLGVAGTHGKTTTSSILAHVLTDLGLTPTSVIGGQVFNLGSNARAGEGEYLVFEADESDGSFLNFYPYLAVITNIDADHMEHYRSFANVKSAFVQYANQVPFYGKAILCLDDPTVKEILPEVHRPVLTYGLSSSAEVRASQIELDGNSSRFRVSFQGQYLGEVTLALLGEHNVLNALAAIAIALELDLDMDRVFASLASFQGVGRRMEHIALVKDVDIYDDYGHHPTEIKATLQGLARKGRRILTVFQPHRYSRTQLLYEDFGQVFGASSELFLMEVYPAGEEPIEGVSTQLIHDAVRAHGFPEWVHYRSRWEELLDLLKERIQPQDVILTLGAGDITKFARELAGRLARD